MENSSKKLNMENVRVYEVISVECGLRTEESVGGLNEDEKAFLESLKKEREELEKETGRPVIFEIPFD